MNVEVANGAQLLDEKIPGWYRRIDLRTLDLSNPQRCICGQLAGGANNWDWEVTTRFLGEPISGGIDWIVRHGFCCQGTNGEDWVLAIKTRLALDALPAPTEELATA